MVVQLIVITPKGEEMIVELCDSELQLRQMTVRQMKEKIDKQLKIGGDFGIVFRTTTLEEDELVVSYGIKQMSLVHVVLMIPGEGCLPEKGDGGMGDKGGKNRTPKKPCVTDDEAEQPDEKATVCQEPDERSEREADNEEKTIRQKEECEGLMRTVLKTREEGDTETIKNDEESDSREQDLDKETEKPKQTATELQMCNETDSADLTGEVEEEMTIL